MRQTTILLSHYTNSANGLREHTVLVNGQPIIRETTDADQARRAAEAEYARTPGYRNCPAVLAEWDGDSSQEVELLRKAS